MRAGLATRATRKWLVRRARTRRIVRLECVKGASAVLREPRTAITTVLVQHRPDSVSAIRATSGLHVTRVIQHLTGLRLTLMRSERVKQRTRLELPVLAATQSASAASALMVFAVPSEAVAAPKSMDNVVSGEHVNAPLVEKVSSAKTALVATLDLHVSAVLTVQVPTAHPTCTGAVDMAFALAREVRSMTLASNANVTRVGSPPRARVPATMTLGSHFAQPAISNLMGNSARAARPVSAGRAVRTLR